MDQIHEFQISEFLRTDREVRHESILINFEIQDLNSKNETLNCRERGSLLGDAGYKMVSTRWSLLYKRRPRGGGSAILSAILAAEFCSEAPPNALLPVALIRFQRAGSELGATICQPTPLLSSEKRPSNV